MIASIESLHDMSEEEVVAAISSYKRGEQRLTKDRKFRHFQSEKSKCYNCGFDYPHLEGPESCRAKDKTCNKCQKTGHFGSVCRTKQRKHKDVSSIIISGIKKIGSLTNKEKESLPKLEVFIGLDDKPPTPTEVVVDTRTQVTLAGSYHLKCLWIKPEQLQKSAHTLRHAGGNAMEILGSYPMYIALNEQLIEDVIYFACGVTNMYLSLASCIKLHLVHEKFPHVNVKEEAKLDINSNEISREKEIPSVPDKIPYPATPENISNLEVVVREIFKNNIQYS